MDTLKLIGRDANIFAKDIKHHEKYLTEKVRAGRFLVIGGAGTIGQAVVKEIFKRQPKILHVIDINENNMVELVRDIRSTLGYIDGDFRTFIIDTGTVEFDALMNWGEGYDYILNLSALKHVRSEKDPFTLMRMIDVNINDTIRSIKFALKKNASKYFCVSTDKATSPVNMMGASKRIMEMYLMRYSLEIPISTARFANVAFSDGSLLFGFSQRLSKRQPIAAPYDIKRYFLTRKESGELCLMSCLLGNNRDIFFPKLDESQHLITFSDIAVRYLEDLGYDPVECSSEEEARELADELIPNNRWPCFFFASDTTGEKDIEEFFTGDEILDMNRFSEIGVIINDAVYDQSKLDYFQASISELKARGAWSKSDILFLFRKMLPDFMHKETGKYLDERM